MKQAAGSRGGRRGADGYGRGRAARASPTSCGQDHTQEHRDGEQVRSCRFVTPHIPRVHREKMPPFQARRIGLRTHLHDAAVALLA